VPQAITVSQLVGLLRDVIENHEFFSDLWLQAEISNYSRASSGHRYFSLKDERSVIRSVLFRDDLPAVELNEGDRVLVHGRVAVYVQRGELQFKPDFVRPEGIGLLAAKYEELKERLGNEGLFDPSRKRALPRFPRRIGVVTSPTGAALQDICKVLSHRWPLATLIVSPATVQGPNAPGEIAAALRDLTREPGLDLAIVARGGGSMEDLWAFNDERVARAIFAFPVPVVSGVGHETDETIADLVADLRAATPSAAAERSSPDVEQLERTLLSIDRAMRSRARETVYEQASALEMTIRRLQESQPDLAGHARDVSTLLREMRSTLERRCASDRARFEHASARISGLNPHATLARGFAIVQKQGGKNPVVSSVKRVKGGDRLSVSVGDGAFWAEVS
jgi:exodeoxyribonuclease VII large subunit